MFKLTGVSMGNPHAVINIREIEGVIITLVAQSTLNKKEIDLQLAKDVVNQFVSQDNKEITVENINTNMPFFLERVSST